MKTYGSMKHVPVNWLGEVPAHWDLKRIKRCFRIIGGNGFSIEFQGNKQGDYPFCKASDISKSGKLIGTAANYVTRSTVEQNHYNVIPANSILFAKIGEAMKKNRRAICICDCCADNNCQGLVPNQIVSSVFAYYVLSCIDMAQFDGGGTVPYIDNSKLLAYVIPVPPREEQDQIVRFLDWKVSGINKLIGVKKKQITSFNEKTLTATNDYVSRGVGSNRAYTRTTMDWAPEIPCDWETSRIRNHFEILKRIAGAEGFDVFSVTQKGLRVRDISHFKGQLAADYSGYQFVHPGEFAMNHMDLLTGGVGIADHLGVTSPDYRVFSLFDKQSCYAPYFLRVFQICYRRHAFYRFGRGAANVGRWRLPADAFRNFRIPLPPYHEQVEIVQAIEEEERKNKAVIDCLQQEIYLLKELKTRLVSDVVTGKIDVRGIDIPEYEYVDEDAGGVVESESEGSRED